MSVAHREPQHRAPPALCASRAVSLATASMLIGLASTSAPAQVLAPDGAVLYAGQRIGTGNGVSITGGVAAATVKLGNGAAIHGPVDYTNSFDAGPGTRLSEAARRVDGLNPIEMPEIPTDPGQVVEMSHGESRAFDPGGYGSFSAGEEVRADLAAGVYAFGGVDAGNGMTLRADTSDGDVTVTIDGSFSAGNGVRIENTGPGRVRLFVRDGFIAGHGAEIEAGVFAGGDITLGNGAAVTGVLSAGGSIVTGHGLNAVHDPVSPRAELTSVPESASAWSVGFAAALVASGRRRRRGPDRATGRDAHA